MMLLKFQSSKLSTITPSTHWAFPVTPPLARGRGTSFRRRCCGCTWRLGLSVACPGDAAVSLELSTAALGTASLSSKLSHVPLSSLALAQVLPATNVIACY